MPALPPPVLTARSPQPAAPHEAARPPEAVIRVTSDALFAGASEVQIQHAGSVYRLKRTALGKLILTK